MKPIERISVTDLVVSNLKELIVSGQLDIGSRLPTEAEICKSLAVSRTTVREALRILQAIGYIEVRPGRGTFVVRDSEEDSSNTVEWFAKNGVQFTDFIEVRMAIEPLAVKLAVKRATDEEIMELREIYESLVKAVSNNDIVGITSCDGLFHSHIVRIAKNQLLVSINDRISGYFTEFRIKVFSDKQGLINSIEPHRRIIDAMETRNEEEAEKAMVYHLKMTLQDLSNALKKSKLTSL